MPSFRLSITPHKAVGARFIARVRRELQKALAEEHASPRKLTQAEIARVLGVHRSVINRQLLGVENLTLGRVGELACVLGREPEFVLRKPEEIPGANYPIATAPEGPVVISSTTGHTAIAPLALSSHQVTRKVT